MYGVPLCCSSNGIRKCLWLLPFTLGLQDFFKNGYSVRHIVGAQYIFYFRGNSDIVITLSMKASIPPCVKRGKCTHVRIVGVRNKEYSVHRASSLVWIQRTANTAHTWSTGGQRSSCYEKRYPS